MADPLDLDLLLQDRHLERCNRAVARNGMSPRTPSSREQVAHVHGGERHGGVAARTRPAGGDDQGAGGAG